MDLISNFFFNQRGFKILMYLNSEPLMEEVVLFTSHEETSKIAILHPQYSLNVFHLR